MTLVDLMIALFGSGVVYAYLGILVVLAFEDAFNVLCCESVGLKLLASLAWPVTAPLAWLSWRRRQRARARPW